MPFAGFFLFSCRATEKGAVMAKRKRKRKRKVTLSRGQCKIITTPAGKRKICKDRRGKVKFRKMSFKPR